MSSFEKYNILSWKKLHFLVTPSELNSILNCHHFVVDNTGVADDYTESNPCEFITKYDALYQKLRNGNRLNWKAILYVRQNTHLSKQLLSAGWDIQRILP